jgi:hypothetical protein
MARYERREPSKRVMVNREVEKYSDALRRASGLARMDNITAVVWKRTMGRFVDYLVVADGVVVGHDYVALVKVSPAL